MFVKDVRSLQTAEFFLFASLMLLSTVVFAVMAHYYQYVDESGRPNNSDRLTTDTVAGNWSCTSGHVIVCSRYCKFSLGLYL